MGFFYGDINQHIPRTSFSFKAIYPSRRAMQEDENRYWAIMNAQQDNSNIDDLPKNIYEILENDYVLVDYTKVPLFSQEQSNRFEQNKNDDNNFIEGDTYAPGNYHYTVWQKQKINKDKNPEYIAIARLHSILPTFETWGTYHIDILEPISVTPDVYGGGKNLFGTKTWVRPSDN